MSAATINPTTNKERILVIDILRGFALLGILLVNVHEISNSWYVTEVAGGVIDRFAQFITDSFFVNKFFTLFSFLFGLGMAIQMIRAEKKGVSFIRLYLQRLFWLLIFGLIHAVFIWDGDILATYALIGFFLLLLRKLNPKTLIFLSVMLVVIQAGINFAGLSLDDASWSAAEAASYTAERQDEIDFFRTASYADIAINRLENTLEVENPWLNLLAPIYVLFQRIDVFSAFLFGLAVGKLKWFEAIDSKLHLWKKIFFWVFPVGLGINMLGGYLAYLGGADIAASRLYDAGMAFLALGAPLLTLGYVSGIVLLSRKLTSLSLFAYTGKMALSVYLTQSIILTLIFYSYGARLFNSIGVSAALLLALVIYSLQLLVSMVWLHYFRFGPFEWVWRSLTYRKLQPLK